MSEFDIDSAEAFPALDLLLMDLPTPISLTWLMRRMSNHASFCSMDRPESVRSVVS
ncbi:hypothetical protein N5C40_20430 [Pseudomonas fulva]|uniref:hypothetical protein n=1 Tax=Pseudomonas fulva TaxID=47880 RepID=UPI00244AF177|nr:hypothetical protein [Pseudomonas fulva]MDH1308886.1 hypothetical protein [Pseudomonas fulva]